MTIVHSTSETLSVACDPFTGRPKSVRMGDDQEPVLAIERVREESAAYPLATGPRTFFVVRTPHKRFRLTFQHRSRRWLVDGIETRSGLRAA
jgi:hypothetical protein